MPDVTERLRAELRQVVASAPAAEPTAYRRITRRVARRRVAAYAGSATALAVFAWVLLLPGVLMAPVHDPAPVERRGLRTPASIPSCERAVDGDGRASGTGEWCGARFELAPTSIRGTGAIRASGNCHTVLPSGATRTEVLVSGTRSRAYPGGVAPDGRFDVPVRLPERLLPGSYVVTVKCLREPADPAGVRGAATFRNQALTVLARAEPEAGRERPGYEGFTVRGKGGPGRAGFELRGSGCFLPQLGRVPGRAQVFYAPSEIPPSEAPPVALAVAGSSWHTVEAPVRADGSWSASAAPPDGDGSERYDFHAFCVDDFGSPGFAYDPVHQVTGALR